METTDNNKYNRAAIMPIWAAAVSYFVIMLLLMFWGISTGRSGWFHAVNILFIAPAGGVAVGYTAAMLGK